MLNIGVTSRAFNGLTISDTAKRMAAGGFRCTELCFVHEDLPGWTYNGIGPLDGITPERVKAAANEFASRGVAVTSLGIFTDLRNPDDAVRDRVIEYAKRYVEFAAEAGIPYLASECGFTPGRRGVNTDTYESDYQRIKDTIREVCLIAGRQSDVPPQRQRLLFAARRLYALPPTAGRSARPLGEYLLHRLRHLFGPTVEI